MIDLAENELKISWIFFQFFEIILKIIGKISVLMYNLCMIFRQLKFSLEYYYQNTFITRLMLEFELNISFYSYIVKIIFVSNPHIFCTKTLVTEYTKSSLNYVVVC